MMSLVPKRKRGLMENKEDGSSLAGFALGFLLGLIGVVIALCIGKKDTTKGALIGWAVEVGVALLGYLFLFSLIAH